MPLFPKSCVPKKPSVSITACSRPHCLFPFVSKVPEGYETSVGSRQEVYLPHPLSHCWRKRLGSLIVSYLKTPYACEALKTVVSKVVSRLKRF